jgi:Cof subfamily protein (haloacid dehalogenase superfamily)
MVRLICIDIDGTLIGPGNRVHPSTWPALAAARDRGVVLALSTGRPALGAAVELARSITPGGFHVFQNGATIVLCPADASPSVAVAAALPITSYRALVEASREHGLPLEAYTAFGLYLERHHHNTDTHQEVIKVTATTHDLLALAEAADPADAVVRVQWVVPFSELDMAFSITNRLDDVIIAAATTPDMPSIAFASVTRRDTSKLSAAQWLADHHNISLSEVSMVGDGEGDISALAGCGFGVAMGNANTKVKAAAGHVVGSVEDGGLAEAISWLLER